MYKVPVIIGENTDYIVFVEPCISGVLVHCDVRATWNKDVKLRLMRDWANFLRLQRGGPVFARHFPEQGTKHIKFLEMFGFEFLHTHDGFDVYKIGGE